MNKLIDAVKTFLAGVEYIEKEENANYVVTKEDKKLLQEAIDTVVKALEKPTYTVEAMKSAWESGCLVGCEQENDIIYNREKSNYLTFERWIEGMEK